ncbi:MAG: hypothetical protein NTZ24_13835, partial [Deltaproteobacteria bacterium]|nr:hypothetical protein [Deltaproteobacteria bacterium]
MSDKKEGIVKENQEIKLCTECHEKPTISKGSSFCASCMARKGNEKRWQKAVAPPEKDKTKKTKEDTARGEKAPLGPNMTVSIDFNKYPHIFKRVEELANDQIRLVDAQIIF